MPQVALNRADDQALKEEAKQRVEGKLQDKKEDKA